MVCDVVEIAAGVPVACVRRDGVGVAVAAAAVLLGVAASAFSMLSALVSVDVAALSSAEPAVTFALVPSSALPVSLPVASACACCSAVA